MRATAKAQRLTETIQRARDDAGLPFIPLTPDTLTLQQVEALADSLQVMPETLLLLESAA